MRPGKRRHALRGRELGCAGLARTCADTRNALRLTVPLCPTTCPTGPNSRWLSQIRRESSSACRGFESLLRHFGRGAASAFSWLCRAALHRPPSTRAGHHERCLFRHARRESPLLHPSRGRRRQQHQLAVDMGCCANRRQDRVSHGKCARTGNSPASSASRTVLPSSNAGAIRLAWFGLDRSYRSRAER